MKKDKILPRPKRRREVSEQERMLWQETMHGSKPEGSKPLLASAKLDARQVTTDDVPRRKRKILKPPSLGDYDNIDRRTAERFRKGVIKFDGRLDLHGMSRLKAQDALHAFLLRHHSRGSRMLLVITGKGSHTCGRGVLQQTLPGWLAGIPEIVLAFNHATQKDGGSGAYYILLRRKR